ncbi:UNVERIFIED_CONTAM: hypothetical protein FKN15_021234 [Acipenser sinensis]
MQMIQDCQSLCSIILDKYNAPTERREEQMDYGEGTLDNRARGMTLIQRQRERKKLEKVKESEDNEQEEEEDEEESESEEEAEERQRERKKLEKVKESEDNEQEEEEDEEESESEEEAEEVRELVSHSMGRATQPLVATGNKNNHKSNHSSTEEEPEWDVNSAFVANAASHIKPKSRTKASRMSKENKENEAKTGERYSEAVKALSVVLKLDQNCEDAVNEIFNCRVLHLMELGFNLQQSILLLDRFTTVQGVLASPEAAKVAADLDSLLDQSGNPCASLWVGNVTVDVKEKQLRDLFKSYGEIDSIRVLHERFCAFVNFISATAAATAMEKLQGKEIESTRLVIRYPDRRLQRDPSSPQRPAVFPVPAPAQPAKPQPAATSTTGPRRKGPVHRNECYFWRTTGCHFGDKCRFKHIPDHRGRDKKAWQT